MSSSGAEVEEAQEGYFRLSLVLEERHTNPNSVMHGGVVATVMDSAAAVALGRLRGEQLRRDNPHATVEMNVSLISAARPGDELIVEGRVLKLGRSVAFCEAEARRSLGRRADRQGPKLHLRHLRFFRSS